MALSRRFLAALGIESDKVEEIITAHAETVDALKAERDEFKADAEAYKAEHKKVSDLEKQLETLKESTKDSYKVKYEAIKEEFADCKKGIENEKTRQTKTDAYKALLKEIGISEKRIDAVTKVSDIDAIQLDEAGAIVGADELKKNLTSEWADFIVKTSTQGANAATPPVNTAGGKAKTKEEIMQIKNTTERQKAWGEYIIEHQNQ